MPAAVEEVAVTSAPAKKGKKTVIIILTVLVIEAVAIIGAMTMLGGSPPEASAIDAPSTAPVPEEDKLIEALVLHARMPNSKSGVAYIYDTEIYVQVKKRHVDRVKGEIEQFQNEIKAEITAIWRTAEPQHFQEPKLETLTRKVYAMLNERFGMDKARNEAIVTKVVIVMSTGFRIDS